MRRKASQRKDTGGIFRRVLAAMLCLALLSPLSMTDTAFGADAASAELAVSKIVKSNTVEVGLNLTAQELKSAGAVIAFNADKLKLIRWDAVKTPLVLNNAVHGMQGSIAAHTKGTDGLSGKPALAYTLDPSSLTSGAGGASGSAIHWNYVYFGAESLKGETLSGERTVTLRFDYVTATDTDEAKKEAAAAFDPETLSQEELLKYVRFAVAEEAAGTPAQYPFSLITSTQDYQYGAAADDSTASGILPIAPTVKFIADGSSVNTGGSSGGGGYAITFFDWDGTVIDAIAAEGDATQLVKEFEAKYRNPAAAGTYTDDAAYKLDNKKGYDFDTWINNDQTLSGLFPANDQKIAAGTPGVADFSNVQMNLLVKAAYSANSSINTAGGSSQGVAASQYTFSDPVYSRYGKALQNDGKYSITYTVKRQNGDGYGVTRLKSPAVVAFLTPDASNAKDVAMLIPIDNTDVTTVEIVPNKAIKTLWIKVIETYGTSNWPGAADQSEKLTIANAEFVKNGSLGFMRTASVEAAAAIAGGGQPDLTWSDHMDLQTFKDAGYTKVTTANVEAAKADLLKAAQSYGPEMTVAQMQAYLKKYE